jgi:hypothetical protein
MWANYKFKDAPLLSVLKERTRETRFLISWSAPIYNRSTLNIHPYGDAFEYFLVIEANVPVFRKFD